MASYYPPINSWYEDLTNSQLFEVVAIDEKSGTIEVQYQDGDIDEFDIESWGQMRIIQAQAPTDEAGAYGLDSEDYLSDTSDFENNDYMNPIELIEPDGFVGFDDM